MFDNKFLQREYDDAKGDCLQVITGRYLSKGCYFEILLFIDTGRVGVCENGRLEWGTFDAESQLVTFSNGARKHVFEIGPERLT